MKKLLLTLLAALAFTPVHAQTAAFTYQGRLSDGGVPANGSYEFQFTLRDALTGGGTVGSPQTLTAVPVAAGVFTVTLDFGSSVFAGAARWLEIGVRTNDSASAFAILAPRQPITSVPYATYAMTPAGPQGTPGVAGPTGPTGARGLTFKGVWSSATTYATDDAVFFNGSAWLAKRASTSVTPVEGADWTLLAQKGDTGATGPQGPTGATGSQGPQGLTGSAGPQGPSGSTGVQGPQGLTGPQGPQGSTGPQGVQGIQGPQGVQGPRGLTFRGAWSSISNYLTDDAVLSGGSAWLALRPNSGSFPVESADWTLLVQQGAAGPQGTTGPTGSPGAQGIQGIQGVQGLTGPQGPAGPADASAVSIGTLADARLSTNVPLRNGTNVFTGTNNFAGVVIVTNANNQITGIFVGNGAGLTNLPPAAINGVLGTAQLPGTLVYQPELLATNSALLSAFAADLLVSSNGVSSRLLGTNTALVNALLAEGVLRTNAQGALSAELLSVTNGLSARLIATNNLLVTALAADLLSTSNGLGGRLLATNTALVSALAQQLSSLLTGNQVYSGSNHHSGILVATNANNQLVGIFVGNGAGLTNLPPAAVNGVLGTAQLPVSVVYQPELLATNSALLSAFAADLLVSSNGVSSRLLGTNTALVNALLAEGVLRTNAQGAFSTDLLSVTNGLSARLIATNNLLVTAMAADLLSTSNGLSGRLLATNTALVSALAQQLSSLLTGNQVYSGSNHHSGILVATNANNQLVGSFAGNGAGITNLPPAAVNGVLGTAQLPGTLVYQPELLATNNALLSAFAADLLVSSNGVSSRLLGTNTALVNALLAEGVLRTNAQGALSAELLSVTNGLSARLIATNNLLVTALAADLLSTSNGLSGRLLATNTALVTALAQQLSSLLTGDQIYSGSNRHSGVLVATNATNVLVGSFTGNGAGLTNLPPAAVNGVLGTAQLPGTLVYQPELLATNSALLSAFAADLLASSNGVSGRLLATNTALVNALLAEGVLRTNAQGALSAELLSVTNGLSARLIATNNLLVTALAADLLSSSNGLSSRLLATNTALVSALAQQLSDLLTGNQIYSGSNHHSGILLATNEANVLVGSFTGNGAGITNLPPAAVNGTLTPGQIPALDASKITSGVFSAAQIPSLNASKINSGMFDTALIADNAITTVKLLDGAVTDAKIAGVAAGKVSGTLAAGNIPSLDGSKIASGTVGDARLSANIPRLDGTNVFSGTNAHAGVIILTNANNQIIGVISGNGAGLTNLSVPVASLVGTLLAGQIPSLDAAKITSGTFSTTLIPNLDASKLTSGTLPADRIEDNSITDAKIIEITGEKVMGLINVSSVPNISAAKLTSGTLADARLSANIPLLNGTNAFTGTNNFAGVAIVTNVNNQFLGTFTGNGAGITNLPSSAVSGALVAAQIPALDAAKITSGTFGTALIPSLDAAKITSGTFDATRIADGAVTDAKIAGVAAGKVSGTLAVGNIPNLDAAKITSGTFGSSAIADGAIITAKLADGAVTDAKVTSIHASKITGQTSGFLPWQVVSSTSLQALPNTGYLCTNDTLTTVNLPTSPSVGDVVRISGYGNSGWKLSQNAGQTIELHGLANRLTTSTSSGSFNGRESSRAWSGVATSSDGQKIVAVVKGGQIYTSTDFGVTWTARAPSITWDSVASSADGTKLVATATGGYIYTSSDSGVTWAERDSGRPWYGVASSADGTKLVAVAGGFISGDFVYTSTDSGQNWTQRESFRSWKAVASSSDGTKLVAVVNNGYIHTSANSGVGWGESLNDSIRKWTSVASSSDGTKLVAVATNAQIYISANSGGSWTARESVREWTSVTSSADGTKLLATVKGGQIFYSTDSGITWSGTEAAMNWSSSFLTSEGSRAVAVVNGGQIFVSVSQTTTTGTAGFVTGVKRSSLELQYVGTGYFIPLSYTGTISSQ
jgi:hypothetical protein